MADKNKKVTIYSTPTCIYCNLAKEHFDENGVKYEDFDVAADMERREEMLEKSGQMGVPVIFVGSEMIIGFDKERLASILGVAA